MSARPRAVDVALAAVLPVACLVVDPWGWAPFGPAKWAVTSFVAVVAIALGLLTDGPALPRWVRGTGGGLLAWLALTALLGPEPIAAWIGTPDRHLGWVTILVLAGLFVAATRAADGAIPAVSIGALVALAGVDLWCLAEWAGWSVVDVAADNGRLVGPFGSSAFTGAALVLLVPIVVATAVDATRPRPWRIAAAITGALAVVPVFGTASRAALVGLAVAGLVALLARARRTSSRRVALVAVGVGVLVVLGVTLGPARDRITSSDAVESRLDEWRVATRTLGDHLVVGLGPEGYRTEFPRRVDRAYVERYGREVATDRAHNVVLDVGLMGGLPAIAMFVALAGFVAVRSWAAARAGGVTLAGMGVASIGMLAHQLLFFPSAEIDPMTWVVAGVVVGATTVMRAIPDDSSPEPVAATGRTGTRAARLGAGVVGVVAAFALLAGVADVAADHSSASALDAAADGRFTEADADAARATQLRPDSFRYELVAATVAARSGTVPALRQAIEEADDALDLAPEDPVLALRRAEWLGRLAAATGTPGDVRRALDEWRRRAREDPLQPEVFMGWGETAAVAGDVVVTESRFVVAQGLMPGAPEPWARRAVAELRLDRIAEAQRAADRAVELDPDDPLAQEASRLVDDARGS